MSFMTAIIVINFTQIAIHKHNTVILTVTLTPSGWMLLCVSVVVDLTVT